MTKREDLSPFDRAFFENSRSIRLEVCWTPSDNKAYWKASLDKATPFEKEISARAVTAGAAFNILISSLKKDFDSGELDLFP